MVCTLLYAHIHSAQLALIFLASKLLSCLGDFPAQHKYELILDVTEAVPVALILPQKVIAVKLVKKLNLLMFDRGKYIVRPQAWSFFSSPLHGFHVFYYLASCRLSGFL